MEVSPSIRNLKNNVVIVQMELLTIPGDMEVFGSALHKNATELTVMDVYDIAAVVGNEFERIIDQYGCEALSRLMPKVVRVLEVLEVLVSRSNINPETEELRCELDRLRLERNERLEKEKKHQKVHISCVCGTDNIVVLPNVSLTVPRVCSTAPSCAC